MRTYSSCILRAERLSLEFWKNNSFVTADEFSNVSIAIIVDELPQAGQNLRGELGRMAVLSGNQLDPVIEVRTQVSLLNDSSCEETFKSREELQEAFEDFSDC